MEGMKYVLLDIEGTVCPITFVKDTLVAGGWKVTNHLQFPYALKALPDVLAKKWDDPGFQPYRDAFPADARASPDALQAHVEDLTHRDVKIAYLKNLQGYLWEEGYKTGVYATPLFPDVAPQLKKWRAAGLELAIYSSGSVFAQKLLFAHVGADASRAERIGDTEKPTVGGDENMASRPSASKHVNNMTELFTEWFDTTNAGLKTEVGSYTKIVEALKWVPSQTLFLSDNVREVDAATGAGVRAVLVDRPGNADVSEMDRERMVVVDNFEDLELGHGPMQ